MQFLLIALIGWYSGITGGMISNILMIGGILLGIWAIVAMKFSVNIFPDVRDNQHLVIRGPGQHPMLTFYFADNLLCLIAHKCLGASK